MIVTNCPRCDEEFRIPAGEIPSDAYAHCPWCRETFPFSEVLGSLPPTLQLLDADGRPLEISEATAGVTEGLQIAGGREAQPVGGHLIEHDRDGGFAVSGNDSVEDPHATVADETVTKTIVDDDWDRQVNLSDSASHVETFADDDSYETLETADASPLQSVSVSGNRSPRKRKGSGIGTFIGIVLGGLLSLPIAGGLLTLLGKTPDWGFWPFLGESDGTSGRVAAPVPGRPLSDGGRFDADPATAPSLRFNQETALTQSASDPAEAAANEIVGATPDDPTAEPAYGSGETGSFGLDSTPEDLADDTSSLASSDRQPIPSEEIDASLATLPDASTGSIEPEGAGGDDETYAKMPPSSSPTVASDAVASRRPSDNAATSAAPGQPTPEELATKAVQMIEVVSSMNLTADASPQEQSEQRRRIGITYQTIAETAARMDSPGDALKALAAAIVSSPLREDVRAAGWQWLKSPNRQSSGIALIGTATESDGATILESNAGETIPLIGDAQMADGDLVLVLGQLDESGETVRVIHSESVR